jgi:hypothetical protein
MVVDNGASPAIKKAIQKRRLARSVVMSANGTSGSFRGVCIYLLRGDGFYSGSSDAGGAVSTSSIPRTLGKFADPTRNCSIIKP